MTEPTVTTPDVAITPAEDWRDAAIRDLHRMVAEMHAVFTAFQPMLTQTAAMATQQTPANNPAPTRNTVKPW